MLFKNDALLDKPAVALRVSPKQESRTVNMIAPVLSTTASKERFVAVTTILPTALKGYCRESHRDSLPVSERLAYTECRALAL